MDKNEIFLSLAGTVIGYFVAVITGMAKVKNELAFIKGQLTQLIKIHDAVDSVKENQIVLTRDQQRMKKDLDAAHIAIRSLK